MHTSVDPAGTQGGCAAKYCRCAPTSYSNTNANGAICTWTAGTNTNSYDYTVTLNKNGGTGGTSTLYVKAGDGTYLDENLDELYNHSCSSGDFVVPTKSNSSFVGYYSQQSGGTQYIDNGGCLTVEGWEVQERGQNETWYAHWQTQATTSYNVSFDCNGGTTTSTFESPQTVNAGAIATTLPDTACTAPSSSQSFDGWKCGSQTYAARTTFKPSGDITCYAQWINNTTLSLEQREAACTSSHGTWSNNSCTCESGFLLAIDQCFKNSDIIPVEETEQCRSGYDVYSCACWTSYEWDDVAGMCQ